MYNLENVIEGFLLALTTMVLLVSFSWITYSSNFLVGTVCTVLLSISFILNIATYLKRWKTSNSKGMVKRIISVLMTLQGVALACWFFDMATTFIVINVRDVGTELNLLGWPNGIFGAMIFYLPAFVSVSFLLFKVKSKASFYGAVALTLLTLLMASMNLIAGFKNSLNAQWYISSSSSILITYVWGLVTITLSSLNMISVFIKEKMVK